MIIIVRDIYNHKAAYTVKDTDTIEVLKAMIEFRIGISKFSQRLIYRGQMLEDERKICHYNIKDHSYVDLCFRQVC
uniref:Ubiquitin-like domain-containing protein n=1 Tax=Meloidogyne hapla TaxID=6305 RepID=A0A1I8BP34_MELHA